MEATTKGLSSAEVGDRLKRYGPNALAARTQSKWHKLATYFWGPLPFMIEAVTPRELRVPGGAAADHANGAVGFGALIVGARDLADAEWRYAALRERGAPAVELRKAARDGLIDVRFRGA